MRREIQMTEAQQMGYDRLEADVKELQARNTRYLIGCLRDLGHAENDWNFDYATRTFYRDDGETAT